MAGDPNNVRPAQCQRYASFLAAGGRMAYELVYWALFWLTLVVLLYTSHAFSRLMRRLDADAPPTDPLRRRQLRQCFYIALACFLVSIVANVFEVYALLALQFCDGEDLMALYWASWTAMQFGSVIAILGTVLTVLHQLQGTPAPPWNLALGTPILIFTGVGHAVQVAARGPVKRIRSMSRSRSRKPPSPMSFAPSSQSVLPPISWQNTLVEGQTGSEEQA